MSEKNLVAGLEKIFCSEGFLSKREIGVGYGVADMVLIKKQQLNRKNLVRRDKLKQWKPLLDDTYFETLKYIPDIDKKRSVSIDYLVEKTHLSKGVLKYAVLRNLEKNKYVKRDKKGYYLKINGWLPLANEVIAIEAKIKDWKRGVIQAARYKSFANRVYLAVPSKIAHLIDRKILTKFKIGLIVYDPEKKEKTILLDPGTEPVINKNKFYVATEFFWNKKVLSSTSL